MCVCVCGRAACHFLGERARWMNGLLKKRADRAFAELYCRAHGGLRLKVYGCAGIVMDDFGALIVEFFILFFRICDLLLRW